MEKIIELPKGMNILYEDNYNDIINEKKIFDEFIDIEVDKFIDKRNGKLKKDIRIRVIVEEKI